MNMLKRIGAGIVLLIFASLALADKKEDVARLMKELKSKDVKTRISAAVAQRVDGGHGKGAISVPYPRPAARTPVFSQRRLGFRVANRDSKGKMGRSSCGALKEGWLMQRCTGDSERS